MHRVVLDFLVDLVVEVVVVDRLERNIQVDKLEHRMKDKVVRKRLVIVYLKENCIIINQTFDRKKINYGFKDLKKLAK